MGGGREDGGRWGGEVCESEQEAVRDGKVRGAVPPPHFYSPPSPPHLPQPSGGGQKTGRPIMERRLFSSAAHRTLHLFTAFECDPGRRGRGRVARGAVKGGGTEGASKKKKKGGGGGRRSVN